MAEKKRIPTFTTSLSNETDLTICSEFIGGEVDCGNGAEIIELPNIRVASYYDFGGNLNGMTFVEGELVTDGVNMPLENDIWINNQGELIVSGDDAEGYYIDEDGYLLYDFCLVDCQSSYYACGYIENDYINA